MEICGTPVQKTFGKPYKKSKTSDWSINVQIDGKKKPKITQEFKTKNEADEYVAQYDGKWFIDITDGNQFIRTEIFDTEAGAKDFIVTNNKKQIDKIKSKKDAVLSEETTFLEQQLEDFENGGSSVPATYDNEIPENIKQNLAEHKSEFDSTVKRAEDDAKSLLLSVAQLYLDENIIKDNQYVQFKMVIEQKGLSSLMFQLDIARKALFKLSEQIHNGMHSARNYEVLTQLQRIVLDVTKYQHEYLDDIEESMKKLSDDFDSGKTKAKITSVVETQDGEVQIIGTNNRAKLLEEINEIVEDSKKTKTPQSVNKKLHIEADDMTDAIEIKVGDDEDGLEDDEDISELGLQSM